MIPSLLDTPVGVPNPDTIESVLMALEDTPHKDIFTLRVNKHEVSVFSRDILLFTIRFRPPSTAEKLS
jgi:hypothetical protein